jgi:membrane protease YdiL (CAAX protease family)
LATFAAVLMGGIFDWATGMGTARTWAEGEYEAMATARLAMFLLVFQIVTLALTIAAAAFFGRGRERLLPVAAPRGGTAALMLSAVTLLVLAAAYGGAVFYVDKRALVSDVQPIVQILNTRTWWLMLFVTAIGAPLAEEFLFRGFLYGVLRRSAAGFAGTAVVTAFIWSTLHASYSLYGMAAIFLIGLYLAWVREKTGSLITPLACHAIYNGLIVLVLASAPDTVFQFA